MSTVSGHLYSITLIPSSPDRVLVSYGIVEGTYRPHSGMFSFGKDSDVTINGRMVISVGELFTWIAGPRNITVTLNPEADLYGLSRKTDFSDTK